MRLKDMPAWIDWLLIRRIYMPFAHWVDYRFHRNQYLLAADIMSAGLAASAAQTLQYLLDDPWWMGAFFIVGTVGLIWIYSSYLKRLYAASAAYERQPDSISKEAAFFILFIPGARSFLLLLGIFTLVNATALVLISPTTHFIVRLVESPMLVLIASSLYIAGCPPPWRDRRAKKINSPLAASPPHPVALPS